jgi:hypothetical protein
MDVHVTIFHLNRLQGVLVRKYPILSWTILVNEIVAYKQAYWYYWFDEWVDVGRQKKKRGLIISRAGTAVLSRDPRQATRLMLC